MTASGPTPGTGPKTRLPVSLLEIRRMFEALDWMELARQVEEESRAPVAIVGPVNSGKSTLFNLIKGRKISAVKAVPGTTKGLVTEQVGPFTLVDTPGFGEVGGWTGPRSPRRLLRRPIWPCWCWTHPPACANQTSTCTRPCGRPASLWS